MTTALLTRNLTITPKTNPTYTSAARNVTFAELVEILTWEHPNPTINKRLKRAVRLARRPLVVMTKPGLPDMEFDWAEGHNGTVFQVEGCVAVWHAFSAEDSDWFMFSTGDTTLEANCHGGRWTITVEVPMAPNTRRGCEHIESDEPVETELYLRLQQVVGSRLETEF